MPGQSSARNEASTAELFALDRWRISDGTTLILAAQGVSADRDVRTTSVPSGAVTNPQASYNRINPRLGIVRSLGAGAILYGNLSALYEPPTNFELEDNVVPGATLEAMQGSVFEVGARGGPEGRSGDGLYWDVSLYFAAIDDEIFSVEDPNAPGTSLVTNVESTVHAGIEALFGGRIGLGQRGATLEPQVALTWSDFSFDGDPDWGDNTLPAAPDVFVRSELIHHALSGPPVFAMTEPVLAALPLGAQRRARLTLERRAPVSPFLAARWWRNLVADMDALAASMRSSTPCKWLPMEEGFDIPIPSPALAEPCREALARRERWDTIAALARKN